MASSYVTTQFTAAGSPLGFTNDEEESVRLAVALQLKELQGAGTSSMELDDEAAVLEEYRKYLEETERFLADRKLAAELSAQFEGIERPPTTPPPPTLEHFRTSSNCSEDSFEFTNLKTDSELELDEEMNLACEMSLRTYEEEKVLEREKSSIPSSSRTVPASRSEQEQMAPCTGCTEEFPKSSLITPPCQHLYCVSCLKQFFTKATQDQEVFPPRCCKLPIPFYLIYRRLTKQEVKRWRDKVAEYTAKDKLYCSNPICSAFINIPPPTSMCRRPDALTCRVCKRGTCVKCKSPEHTGDCPEDDDITATLSTAAENGWARCSNCHAIVELSFGCLHMSCRCGAEWCYRCGTKWGTCSCGDFESDDEARGRRRKIEDLMIKQEDEKVIQKKMEERERERREAWKHCDHGGKLSEKLKGKARARVRGGTNGKGKEREVDYESGREYNGHWAEEGLWKYKLGESRCDVCECVMKDYIWLCKGCGMEACMACREDGI
ncbi:hypothetical protein BDZ91DRAFT_752546 [Kalaharituber pfeilii]|nr:hypothetical protein BDZ91DRAFT_752546 [Kalaharituber pfeilii]